MNIQWTNAPYTPFTSARVADVLRNDRPYRLYVRRAACAACAKAFRAMPDTDGTPHALQLPDAAPKPTSKLSPDDKRDLGLLLRRFASEHHDVCTTSANRSEREATAHSAAVQSRETARVAIFALFERISK